MFQLEISDHDRMVLVFGLGIAYAKLGEMGADAQDLYKRIVGLSPNFPPVEHFTTPTPAPKGGTAAAAAILAPPPPAKSVKKYGKTSDEILELTPLKVERSGKRLRVKFKTGNDWMDASVWDEGLMPHVAARVKQPTRFFVTRKDKYINIVGFEA